MNLRRGASIVLAAAGLWSAAPAHADPCWQLAAPGVTVVACGRADSATAIAKQIVVTQQVVSWMIAPAVLRPSPALVLALPKDVIDEYFGDGGFRNRDSLGRDAAQSYLYSLPQATVVIYTPARRGQEHDQMRYLYAGGLIAGGETAAWPACVRFGLTVSLSAMRIADEERVRLPLDVQFPAGLGYSDTPANRLAPYPVDQFLLASDGADVTRAVRDRRGLSCFTLARMAIAAEGAERAAYRRYFDLIGAGTPPADAAPQAFAVDAAQFDARLLAFANRIQAQPTRYDLWVGLGDARTDWPAPQQVSPEHLRALLIQLRTRMFGTPASSPASANEQ